jgi:hypothetical protein
VLFRSGLIVPEKQVLRGTVHENRRMWWGRLHASSLNLLFLIHSDQNKTNNTGDYSAGDH